MLNKAAAFVVALALAAALVWAVSLRFRSRPEVDFSPTTRTSTATRAGGGYLDEPLSGGRMETPPLASREQEEAEKYRALVEGAGSAYTRPPSRRAAPSAARPAPVAVEPPPQPEEDLVEALEAVRQISQEEESRQRFMGTLDRTHGALFESMGLSPAEKEEFKAMLVDKRLAEVRAAGRQGPSGEEPLETPEEVAQRLRDYLGEDLNAAYQDYEDRQPARNMTLRIGELMGRRGQPLTGEQEASLTRALLEAAREMEQAPPPAGASSPEEATGQERTIAERMAQKAAEILDPDQLPVFLETLERTGAPPPPGGSEPPPEH